MSDHDHHDPSHAADSRAPEMQDSGSRALAEALRSSFVIVKIAMAALVVVIFAAGIFTVGPQEKAIILRFGKPQGEGQKMLLSAGLHWSLPYPIDEVIRIPITENQIVNSSVGWYAMTHEQEVAFEALGTEPQASPSLNPAFDGYLVTADKNIIHSRATVTYHIEDPRTAIFNFASGTNHEFNLAGISNVLQNAANNALLATAARFNVDDILTRDPSGFKDAVRLRIRELADREQLGVGIDDCQIRSEAPRQLKDVFAAVTTARQNRDKLYSEALAEQSRILNQADAQANSITNTAESARHRYVEYLQADARAFTALRPKYESNPNLFAQLEMTRAMSVILASVGEKKFLPTHTDGKPAELRLLLNNELPQQKSGANP